MYYESGDIYEGEWLKDKNHGQGIMRFSKKTLHYINLKKIKKRLSLRWWIIKCDFSTCVQANGNWYEGTWGDGMKNGNGKFYYSEKGQLYEGIWVDGVAKCGTLSDFGRNEAPTPTKYPIPQVCHHTIK